MNSQIKLNGLNTPNRGSNDSINNRKSKKVLQDKASIDLYKLFNTDSDEKFVDTTLILEKDYKYNYLREDNFGLMPFANTGQTYNSLTLDFDNTQLNPLFGARARHFNYLEKEDIHYYRVPTPWTRLFYKTAFQQGQVLDAFFTSNLSPQFNFSVGYKGLRSLGNYQHAITSTGNFRFTTNYQTKNERYKLLGHITMQDLMNEENGGLTDADVINFESGDEEFLDRSIFDPNFENAENILKGKQFYINQSYSLISKKDSLQNNQLDLTHTLEFNDKYYEFYQSTADNTYFGASFTNAIKERTTLEEFKTGIGVNYSNTRLGNLQLALNYNDINYGYNSIVVLSGTTIPNRIKTNFLSFNAVYNKDIKGFNLNAKGGVNLSEDFSAQYINAKLSKKVTSDINLEGRLNISTQLPNYNTLLYQSNYINYNWYNYENFKTVNTQQIAFNIESEKLVNASVDITNIYNYTYFNLDNTTSQIKPQQHQGTIQYLRLKLQRTFRLGNFALDNTLMYQNVTDTEKALNVPDVITRNTLYYSNQFFKKAMTLQTGITLNYFTEYNANGYDPLLAEFYTQDQTKIGGFPRLDFFINAKIRQTRIFFKAEHFNSSFTGYNYFSAPNNPYRDFTIRFGLVWDFFL